MSAHLERRTEVPNDEFFFFSEKQYIEKLKQYECRCAEFDACVGEPHEIQEACTLLRIKLGWLFANIGCMDSIRYDFIQHYLAYHRSKNYELDCEPERSIPKADIHKAYAIRHTHLCERKAFHRQQAKLLQQVLVHRAGHRPHAHNYFHSAGQVYYNVVDGCVASVYEADRADRQEFAVYGPQARGFSAKVYVGDVRMTANGLSIYNGENMPWSKVEHTGMVLDS